MTTCSVLRCLETPDGAFTLLPGSNLTVPVCAGHKTALEGGARWMVNGGTGTRSESPSPDSAGVSLLMGDDLPEHGRLVGFGVGRIIGDEPGLAVTLEIETADGREQISFWTTDDVGTRLGSFLTGPPNP